MRKTEKASPRKTSAFTLLEILLAITITGFVLSAAATLIVSVTNIWSSRQQTYFFEDHVDGVSEFLQSCFSNSGTQIGTGIFGGEKDDKESSTAQPTLESNVGREISDNRLNPGQNNDQGSSGMVQTSENPISWASPPGFSDMRDPLLNFKLSERPPLLINLENAPVLAVSCFLHYKRDEGLSLLWYSMIQEETEDENDLRRTLISPYVTEILYIYWDERFEKWEEEGEPKEGENDDFLLPRFVKLKFEYEGITKERTLSIPVPSRSVLLF